MVFFNLSNKSRPAPPAGLIGDRDDGRSVPAYSFANHTGPPRHAPPGPHTPARLSNKYWSPSARRAPAHHYPQSSPHSLACASSPPLAAPRCPLLQGHGSDRRRRLPPRRPARVVRRERPAAAGLRPRARRRQEGHPLRRPRRLHPDLQVPTYPLSPLPVRLFLLLLSRRSPNFLAPCSVFSVLGEKKRSLSRSRRWTRGGGPAIDYLGSVGI